MALKDTKKFATTADIKQKINGTIIMYDNIPVYCQNSGDSTRIEVYGLLTDKSDNSIFRKTLEYDDDKFIYQSPRIGYVNKAPNNVVYVSRIPSRQFHLGLTHNILEYRTITGTKTAGFAKWPFVKELHEAIINTYPTALEVLKRLHKVDNTSWSQAFSRTLAFGFSEQNGLKLFHKNTPIAYFNPKKSCFESIREGSSLVENILIKHGIKAYAP